MLEISDVSVQYGKIRALEEISLRVNNGELLAVLGPNGAGKTTLMRAIMGQKSVHTGEIRYKGTDITSLAPWERFGHGIAPIPEGGRVFPDATVKQNLKVGALQETDQSQVESRLADIYDLFPRLQERSRQQAGTLSGGEQQMLAIGRALMGDPELILVDEISMGLMPKLVDLVFDVLADLNDRGISLLQIEQNVHKTLAIADRAYVIENGRVVAEGTPAELQSTGAIEESYLGL
jgi:branched-chain amino acid transport system ATP-binding protein